MQTQVPLVLDDFQESTVRSIWEEVLYC